jgi:hypothetical protein
MEKQTKPRLPKIIRFSIEDKEDFQTLMDSEKFMDTLYTEAINSIEDGIKNNLDNIQLFKIADYNSIVSVKKENINFVLDKAIEFYADKEDYDLCQIIKNLKQ